MNMNQHDVNDMRQEEEAVCEYAAVALRAFRKSGVGVGDNILIYGIGVIGLLIAQWSKVTGVKNIVLVDGAEEKVELAQKMGITMVVQQGKLSEVMVADACIECTGISEGLAECVSHVRPGGIVVCVGAPGEDVDFSQETYLWIQKKELALVGVSTDNASEMEEWNEAVRAVREGRLDVEALMTLI